MADPQPELSSNLRRIADALKSHGQPPEAVFCGFDLWTEVLGSPHISLKDYLKGGKPARGDEDKSKTLVIPIIVLGGRMIVCMDPTIPPQEFYFKP